jgi:archaellum component FlaC
MARRKGVAAPKKALVKETPRESWMLGNLRARHERFKASLEVGHEDVDDSEINAWMDDAIDHIEDFEKKVLDLEKQLADSEKTIESLESDAQDLRDKLEEFDTAVSDAARRVIELVPVVLGREDVVSESIEAFDLRRAVEDLETAC